MIIYHHRFTVQDRTYNIGLVSSIAEPSIGIIAACVPTLRRLGCRLMPHYFTEASNSYQSAPHTQPKSHERHTLPAQHSHGSIDNLNRDMDDSRLEAGKSARMYRLEPFADPGGSEEHLSRDEQHGGGGMVDSYPQKPNRSRSVKTGTSEPPGEVVEAVPEHVLNKH